MPVAMPVAMPVLGASAIPVLGASCRDRLVTSAG